MLNFENLDKYVFPGEGEYDIPIIKPENIDIAALDWIPFNYAKTAKDRKNKGVHFYLDDYQFQRLWNRPDMYIDLLSEFGAVCTPDFSQFTDMPVAMRIYNHYRKHWLGAYWQMHGIHVIPTICWSNNASFDYCLDGEPKDSIVSISSIGTQKKQTAQRLFETGCKKVIDAIHPADILWYGKCPVEFEHNAVVIPPHYDDIVKRCKNGR